MRLFYILVLLTISLPAQTLDTSLDTEKRTNKRDKGKYPFYKKDHLD